MDDIRNSRVLALMQSPQNWRDYEPLLDECTDISEEILKALAKIEDGEQRGRFRLASLRKAIASNRSGKNVEDLLKRLQLLRDQVIFKSCKLGFLEIEPTVFPGELRDIHGPLNDDYRDLLVVSRSKQATTSPTGAATMSTQQGSSAADEASESARRAKLRDDPDIELVCRRLVIKWEPLLNAVHRYMGCRCILRKTSPASCEEEMTLLVSPFEAPCPRHNDRGVTFRDYGDDDYGMDPYFDRFGGYDRFRFLVLLCSKEGAYSALGGEKFMSEEDYQREKDMYFGLSEVEQTSLIGVIMEHYFLEAWDHFDRMGIPLPPHVVETLQEKRRQEKDKHPEIRSSISSEIQEDFHNSSMCRESQWES
ncbi:hypothetical protein NEMBOFW57_010875 [Staphylotrichum longicolle]|uniref:Uncharacterized protein n=1 Tax=Staphylotrichum longicolle TaxID=669026 RepID=A0AAD4ENU8_9PEZI|nr:hypothetical protein NEMBOFW57_010875 [Staphylotrichum longicolle]